MKYAISAVLIALSSGAFADDGVIWKEIDIAPADSNWRGFASYQDDVKIRGHNSSPDDPWVIQVHNGSLCLLGPIKIFGPKDGDVALMLEAGVDMPQGCSKQEGSK